MIGTPELIAIIVAALFLFGPQKLPELARSLGGAMGEFKKAQRAAELELNQFDAYTRKAGNANAPGEKEKEQKDTSGSSKEIKTSTDLKTGTDLKTDTNLKTGTDLKTGTCLENTQEAGKPISEEKEP